MVKIFIDPGHGGSDSGATAYGFLEKNINLQIAKEIQRMLVNEYASVHVKMSRTGDQTVSLSARTAAANRWGADFYLSVHINAGGGTGFESYVYPNVDRLTRNYQSVIHSEIIKATGLRDRGQKQANFHVLRETYMPALLTENGFIDNRKDAGKLKDRAFIQKIAKGHVEGIVKAFGLKRKSGSSSNTKPVNSGGKSGYYKVQIGAFIDRRNAEQLAKQARKAGFNVYIVKDK